MLPTPYSLRLFRLGEDSPAAAKILNRCMESFGAPERFSVPELEHLWTTWAGFDPSRDAVVALHGEQVVAYAKINWFDEHQGPRVYFHDAHVDPEWLHQGIGTALLRWVHDRIGTLAATHAVRPAEMRAMVNDLDAGGTTLLMAARYRRVASDAVLIRPHLNDIPEAPLPSGLEIRPVTEDQYRAIYAADIEAFRDHFGFSDQGEAGWRRFREDPHFDPSWWKVAWEDNEVVGQVRTFVNPTENAVSGRKRAWTEDISVRRPWRNQGVARALICASLRDLRAAGFEEAALGVHTENPTGAFHLYTDLGYEVVATATQWARRID